MGTELVQNDTLKITTEQGFPVELDYEQHMRQPLSAEQFAGRVFSFSGKQGIRTFCTPPVRTFLVHYIDGKWLYWGLIHILEVTHDYVEKETSGTFKIIHIYSPEEMQYTHRLIDRNPETNYLDVDLTS